MSLRRLMINQGGIAPMALYLNGVNQSLRVKFTASQSMSFRMKNFNNTGFALDARDNITGPPSTFIYQGDAYNLTCYINNVLTPTNINTGGEWKTIYVEFTAAFTARVTLGAIDYGTANCNEQYLADVRIYSAPLTTQQRFDLINSPDTLAASIQHRYLFRKNLNDSIGADVATGANSPTYVAL